MDPPPLVPNSNLTWFFSAEGPWQHFTAADSTNAGYEPRAIESINPKGWIYIPIGWEKHKAGFRAPPQPDDGDSGGDARRNHMWLSCTAQSSVGFEHSNLESTDIERVHRVGIPTEAFADDAVGPFPCYWMIQDRNFLQSGHPPLLTYPVEEPQDPTTYEQLGQLVEGYRLMLSDVSRGFRSAGTLVFSEGITKPPTRYGMSTTHLYSPAVILTNPRLIEEVTDVTDDGIDLRNPGAYLDGNAIPATDLVHQEECLVCNVVHTDWCPYFQRYEENQQRIGFCATATVNYLGEAFDRTQALAAPAVSATSFKAPYSVITGKCKRGTGSPDSSIVCDTVSADSGDCPPALFADGRGVPVTGHPAVMNAAQQFDPLFDDNAQSTMALPWTPQDPWLDMPPEAVGQYVNPLDTQASWQIEPESDEMDRGTCIAPEDELQRSTLG